MISDTEFSDREMQSTNRIDRIRLDRLSYLNFHRTLLVTLKPNRVIIRIMRPLRPKICASIAPREVPLFKAVSGLGDAAGVGRFCPGIAWSRAAYQAICHNSQFRWFTQRSSSPPRG
jgi:hypothetical protein